MSQKRWRSWGYYPKHGQTAHQVLWRSEIPPTLTQLGQLYGTTLPYGYGRSYGDSCLAVSDHVLSMQQQNRLIEVNWETGKIIAEAGMSLAELIGLSVPNGWFLPVTPGTKYVSLGGALANDVHGKNHHRRGSFGCHVLAFGLQRSDCQEPLICTPDSHTELFAATIGGLGLTGIITWVAIQLMPICSDHLDVLTLRFDNLDEWFALNAQHDISHEYTVSWLDLMAPGHQLGRGVLMAANHLTTANKKTKQNKKPLSFPIRPPFSLVNRLSQSLFCRYYYHRYPKKQANQAHYDGFFYPLDGLLGWNKVYGRKGFVQHQCVIPLADAKVVLPQLCQLINRSGFGSCLSVLKQFGTMASPGLLSFPMAGITLAADFPYHHKLNSRLFQHLNAIVHDAGGHLYPAKDALMSASDFQRGYPNWHQLESHRDPMLCSRFWQRVTG